MQDLAEFAGLFYPQLAELAEFRAVEADDMPEPYRGLLAHDEHMTESVEAFHGEPVDVQVVAERRDGETYARTSVLLTHSAQRRVQLGIMQINFAGLPEPVRAAIIAGGTPLGRILIRHNVLRRVELIQLWRVKPGPALRLHLELSAEQPIFGRTARILVGGRPAVALLEIVRV